MRAATALAARDRSVWALFKDWCAGADLAALPADPQTLAQFIAENPAALATQRRRVATINTSMQLLRLAERTGTQLRCLVFGPDMRFLTLIAGDVRLVPRVLLGT